MEKRLAKVITNEESVCKAIQAGVTEFWAAETEGKFTPNASKPSTSEKTSNTATSNTKPAPPKINDMESLAKIQESNRKRALELHAKLPSTRISKRDEGEEMEVEGQTDEGLDEDQAASRRAYIQRCKEEQNEQRKLNASHESASLQYGEEHPAMQGQKIQQSDSPRLSVRRRGGFVHDISKAKQWERPSSIDGNCQIPPGI